MFADPEVFTCIKRYHIAHQNARNAGTFSPGLFLHAIMAEDSAFLPGAAPEGSLPGGDPSSTLPLIFTLQMPQEPLQLQSKQCRKAFVFIHRAQPFRQRRGCAKRSYQEVFCMKKITRRTVLRASGLAAASLALSGCAPAGSACVGNGFSDWLKQTFGKDSAASSESAEAATPDAGTPDAGAASEPPAEVPTPACPPTTPTPLPASPAAATAAWWA